MRIGVIGAGLAGTLLAWRLASPAGSDALGCGKADVELLGDARDNAATAASGGAVRAYETHPVQRRLAADSLAELLSSRVLLDWADFRRTGSWYVRADGPGLAAELAEIERVVPGSVSAERPDLRDVPAGTVAVAERFAGYISPARLCRFTAGGLGTVIAERVVAVTPRRGDIDVRLAGGGRRTYDVVVVAAGAWTPSLLRASGLAANGLRTKAIEYAVYRTGPWRPPVFVDETSGLFGRPTADGGVLIGLPTDRWGCPPGRVPVTDGLRERAVRVAAARLPRLRLGSLLRHVVAADCYTDQPVLRLRPTGAAPGLFTFTGGSGGSVKTALAASRAAAGQLLTGVRETEAAHSR